MIQSTLFRPAMVKTSPSSGWGSAQTTHPSASPGRMARIPGKTEPYFTIRKKQNLNVLEWTPTAQAAHKAVRCLLCSPSPHQMFLSRRKVVTAQSKKQHCPSLQAWWIYGGRSLAETWLRGKQEGESFFSLHTRLLSVGVIQQNRCEFAECFR